MTKRQQTNKQTNTKIYVCDYHLITYCLSVMLNRNTILRDIHLLLFRYFFEVKKANVITTVAHVYYELIDVRKKCGGEKLGFWGNFNNQTTTFFHSKNNTLK